MNSFQIRTSDDLELHVNSWEIKDPRADLIIVHGMAEHSGRYDEFAQFCNTQQFNVFAMDSRGHGKSIDNDNIMGFIKENKGWETYLKDLDLLLGKVQKDSRPCFVLGHSMGAIVALSYHQQFNRHVHGVVLSALTHEQNFLSSIGLVFCRLQNFILGKKSKGKIQNSLSFGAFNKAFKPSRTDFDWLSRDESEVDQYLADPLCGQVFTSQFFYDLAQGTKSIYQSENLRKLDAEIPFLMISGEADPVAGGMKKIQSTFNFLKNQMKDIQLKTYPDSRHEILNELNKKEVYHDIVEWMKLKLNE